MENNNRFIYIIMAMFLLGCQDPQKDKMKRPNILFLLADDLGYNEIGAYGQKIIKTSELDKLAASSMKFTNFYAGNAACAPSRAVLLIGKNVTNVAIRGNAGSFGNDRWEGMALDQDAFTLGEMLKEQGYQTAFIEKWHLDRPKDVNAWVSGHGFDYAVQEQWRAPFNPIRTFPPNRLWVNGEEEYIPYDYKKYSCKDELLTDLAFDFLKNRERENPFFLFMSYRAPHSFEGPIRDILFYADQDWPDIEKAHAPKITLLDRQIGRLLRQLEKIGVLDNTLVVFTRDNGPHFALEAQNLAKAYPQIVEEMNAHFASARTETARFPFGGVIQDHLSMNKLIK